MGFTSFNMLKSICHETNQLPYIDCIPFYALLKRQKQSIIFDGEYPAIFHNLLQIWHSNIACWNLPHFVKHRKTRGFPSGKNWGFHMAWLGRGWKTPCATQPRNLTKRALEGDWCRVHGGDLEGFRWLHGVLWGFHSAFMGFSVVLIVFNGI